MSGPRPWDDARTGPRADGPPPGPGGPGGPPRGPRADLPPSGAGRDLGWGDVDRRPAPPSRAARTRTRTRLPLAIGGAAVAVLAVAAFVVLGPGLPSPLGSGRDAAPAAPTAPAAPSAPRPADPVPSAPSAPATPPPAERGPGGAAGGASLSREPEDRTAFALAARERTVTIVCLTDGSQGSGWPLRASDLGAAPPGPGTLIVTNAHVVTRCRDREAVVEVGGRRATGRVVGYDLFETQRGGRDLALILVDLDIEPFPVSSDVEVGHWVMAVGSPSGLDGTVTFGSVANDRDGVLIFDAAISPGNSGGPLINARGEVIGTNTWLLGEYGTLSMALRVDVLCVRLLECRP